jgi:hypothetical protein
MARQTSPKPSNSRLNFPRLVKFPVKRSIDTDPTNISHSLLNLSSRADHNSRSRNVANRLEKKHRGRRQTEGHRIRNSLGHAGPPEPTITADLEIAQISWTDWNTTSATGSQEGIGSTVWYGTWFMRDRESRQLSPPPVTIGGALLRSVSSFCFKKSTDRDKLFQTRRLCPALFPGGSKSADH